LRGPPNKIAGQKITAEGMRARQRRQGESVLETKKKNLEQEKKVHQTELRGQRDKGDMLRKGGVKTNNHY